MTLEHNIELLEEKIGSYLTDIQLKEKMISELQNENTGFKKEIAAQKKEIKTQAVSIKDLEDNLEKLKKDIVKMKKKPVKD